MIEFLTQDEVIFIHEEQIHLFGGAHGIRDTGLLQSALAQPQATFAGEFLHADVFEMAAAYLFHLAMNHPFLDGNKRVAAESAVVFLQMNGWQDIATDEELVELTLSVTQGQSNKQTAAQFFREHTRKLN